ncbi:CHAT domain-containing protein [Coleofasciculus sp. H7-2]|uniref:CHAT domain-containing protein n=1 Tax=Coleofasciculus sp. H7-2 TaxID=3351545 RepID=UPI00366CC0A6
MTQERIKAYHQLIRDLLSNSSQGQEILIANSHLLDEGLVQTMVEVAEEWAQRSESPEVKLLCRQVADFLIKIARQMAASLGISLSTSTFSPPTTRDSQLIFLFQALQLASESEDNPQALYSLLQDNLKLLDDNFAELLRTRATATLPKAELKEAQSLAGNILLFTAMIKQFPLENQANNLEIAIAGYEVAATVFTPQVIPEMWAMIQNGLGDAYCERSRGERAENLEIAIGCFSNALQVFNREGFAKEWANIQNNMDIAYSHRILGERAKNLETAIGCFVAALQVNSREALPFEWARTQANLGSAYFYRIRGEQTKNLEIGINYHSNALGVFTRQDFPQQWTDIQIALGGAYARHTGEPRVAHSKAAIKCLSDALEVATYQTYPYQWAKLQHNLGAAYCSLSREERGDNLEKAIDCFKAALQVYTRDPFQKEWAQIQHNIGNVYFEMEEITKAMESFQLALEIYTPATFPINCLQTGRSLGLAAFEIGDWATAIQGLDYAIQGVEQSQAWAVYQKSKQEILENAIKIYELIIAACLLIGQPEKAVEYAERSKARNLVELLVNRDVYPQGEVPSEILIELDRLRRQMLAMQPQENSEEIGNLASEQVITNDIQARNQLFTSLSTELNPTQSYLNTLQQQLAEILEQIKLYDPEFSITQKVKPIQFSEIQDLLDDYTAIVEWYISDPFFRTFIITRNHPQPIVCYSSDTGRKELERWANNYRHSYTKKKEQWRSELNTQLAELSKILHIDEIIELIPPHITQLILIPHRWLHLFPLHALPVGDAVVRSRRLIPENSELGDRPPDGYRLLDCFPNGVRYAPSCQLLQLAQKRDRPEFSHLFAIANPTKDRYLLELQAANIRHRFKSEHSLAKDDANKKAIQNQQLSLTNCVHFGCHGEFNPDSPLESALILANKERLTLLEILALNLSQCRLVTLSACETGLTESSTTDEYIGLPFGFLLAGSPSMVSTLWKVDQLASTLLLIRFHENLETPSTITAFSEAQQWLRNLTSEKLEAELERL